MLRWLFGRTFKKHLGEAVKTMEENPEMTAEIADVHNQIDALMDLENRISKEREELKRQEREKNK